MSIKKKSVRRKIHKKKPTARQAISRQQEIRLRTAIQAHMAGHTAFAEAEYRALIADKARTPELFSNLALICARAARHTEAQNLWIEALAMNPRFVDAAMNLADSYQQAGKIDQSISCYRRVIAENPQAVVAKYLLANLLKSQGKFEQAAAYYKEIMEQQPEYTQAHFAYSGLHRYSTAADPHIGMMLDLYQREHLQPDNRIHLAFALAKAFEDIHEYAQAFKYLETGNRMRSEIFDYRIEGDERLIRNIMQTFTRDALQHLRVDSEKSNRPIFVVGMPRSGTSLVEKILSSHSGVHGAGELDYFHSLVATFFMEKPAHFQFSPLGSYSGEKFAMLGKAYLEKINFLDQQARHITDKMPFNLLLIGLIKIALPNAKIIHCVRDAKDNCLSLYKTNFATENYRFAYDLKTLGQFHNLYRMLMKHWHQVMPGAIHDIAYESLTLNPEIEIRKLLAACDLEWQDSCLRFDKTAGTVKTASFYQVRQPMYATSVNLWEKYREFLRPLLDELDRSDTHS